MRDAHPESPSVVVGIDGSRSGVTAALWAVDEAVARDVPLRLVYAIEPFSGPTTPADAARSLATAEIAVRQAFTAVESAEQPVKIEVEILQGRPTDILHQAGRAATMMCVGAVGLRHVSARIGSTAAELATRALCPVAIVRGYDPSPATPGAIVVEVDSSSDGEAVLQHGIDEALLRKAPLVALAVWHSHFTDLHDSHAVAVQNRRSRAALDRRLTRCTRSYPELDVRSVAVHGSLLDYLSRHALSIQLVIVGRRRAGGVSEMTGPPSYAALHNTDCSVMVCNPHGQL